MRREDEIAGVDDLIGIWTRSGSESVTVADCNRARHERERCGWFRENGKGKRTVDARDVDDAEG